MLARFRFIEGGLCLIQRILKSSDLANNKSEKLIVTLPVIVILLPLEL